MATATSSAYKVPHFSNNYFVHLEEYKYEETPATTLRIPVWLNPFAKVMHIIPPFIPTCSRETTEVFKKHIDNAHIGSLFCQDPIIRFVLVVIPTEDLMSFSQVSKCCYVATKSDFLWQEKIKFSFCNVTCMPEPKCSFSPEQQFQIAYKKLQFRQRPYLCQYSHNLEKYADKIPEIIKVKKAWHQDSESYEKFVGIIAGNTVNDLDEFLDIIGVNFDGTPQSIAPESQQGLCLAALDLIHSELNNQEAFEEMVQASQTAANNTSTPKGDSGRIEELSGGMGADDDYHFSTIEETFGSESPLLTDELVCNALSAFKNIQSMELKMKAFTLILINNQLTDDIATTFYEALPKALQNRFKDLMIANGHSMAADQLRSQIAKDAAYQVYVNLQRKG